MLYSKIQEPKKSKKTPFKKEQIIIVILSILLVSAIVLAVFQVTQKNDDLDIPEKGLEERANDILIDLSKIYFIPEGEEPTVVTIKDVEKLKESEPEFYTNAKNGDNVIIIASQKIAILYRQSENKILRVSPVLFEE